MEYLKKLTALQLTLVCSGALIVASVVLSHDSKFGYVLLVLAIACGVGALFKSVSR